jgi:hypothetical protein
MFGVGGSAYRWSGPVAALGLIVPLVAACSALPSMPSMPSIPTPSLPSWFTSSGSNANASAAAPNTSGAPMPLDFECPPVQVRTGASTLSASATPGEPTATSLRYQVSIGATARECRVGPTPNTVTLKVGMQGRVIIGPEGSAVTNIDVPVRFAVVRELVDTKLIATKLDRVHVTIPPEGGGSVLFTHVTEGLEFPIPRGNDLENYIIYIGFDAVGAEPEPRKPAPKRAKPSRARQTG